MCEISDLYQKQIRKNKRLLITAVEGNAKDIKSKNTLTEENLVPGEVFSDCSVITDVKEFRKTVSFQ